MERRPLCRRGSKLRFLFSPGSLPEGPHIGSDHLSQEAMTLGKVSLQFTLRAVEYPPKQIRGPWQGSLGGRERI